MKPSPQIALSLLIASVPLAAHAQRSDGAAASLAPMRQDVEFRSGDVTLSATLLVPSSPFAALVLVHGSGRELRMLGFAREFAANGLAVLTYDKRGVGKSGGVYAGPEVDTNNVDPPNLELLAGDASAAAGELAHLLAPRSTPIGLFGASQGGWIVPLAAARTPEVKFMIMWSGPLVTTLEQLRFQFLTEGKADYWDHHSEAEAREQIHSDPDRYRFVATDPADALRKLSIPGLWLYGGRDVSQPSRLSIERLDALAASGKPFEHVLFPDAGHQLPEDEALPALFAWLKKTVAAPRSPDSRQH